MNVDVFDNRTGFIALKGAIEKISVQDAGEKYPSHVCLLLNSGFNVLIELDQLYKIVEEVERINPVQVN